MEPSRWAGFSDLACEDALLRFLVPGVSASSFMEIFECCQGELDEALTAGLREVHTALFADSPPRFPVLDSSTAFDINEGIIFCVTDDRLQIDSVQTMCEHALACTLTLHDYARKEADLLGQPSLFAIMVRHVARLEPRGAWEAIRFLLWLLQVDRARQTADLCHLAVGILAGALARSFCQDASENVRLLRDSVYPGLTEKRGKKTVFAATTDDPHHQPQWLMTWASVFGQETGLRAELESLERLIRT